MKPKPVGKGRERVTIKIIVQIFSYPTCYREFQKIAKKEKKILLWLLFKEKQVGKGRERVKIKIFVPSISYLIRNRELQKNNKRIKKIRKHQYGFFLGQNMLEKAEKEWKWKLLFRSFPTRPLIENSEKNSKKIQKITKHHYGLFPSEPRLGKAEKEWK